MRPRKIAPLVLVALAVACASGAGARGTQAAGTLPTPDGRGLDLRDLRGRVVVLHFFAMSSLAAQADHPQLTEAAAAGVTVVGVSVDQDSAALLEPWAQASGVTWPLALASPEILSGDSAFGPIPIVPSTIILDDTGRIAWRLAGQLPDGALAAALADL